MGYYGILWVMDCIWVIMHFVLKWTPQSWADLAMKNTVLPSHKILLGFRLFNYVLRSYVDWNHSQSPASKTHALKHIITDYHVLKHIITHHHPNVFKRLSLPEQEHGKARSLSLDGTTEIPDIVRPWG